MPIIKSAIKKLRKDRKRTKVNAAKKALLKQAIKKAQKSKKPQSFRLAIGLIDKAAKNNLMHKNKASRLKSRLSRLVAKPSFASESKSPRLKAKLQKLVLSKVNKKPVGKKSPPKKQTK